jgi:predicted porin
LSLSTPEKLLGAAVLGTLCGVAHAQSSVVLYGSFDAGISYVNHAKDANGKSASLLKFDDGVDGGNRFGMRGTEDLGGGLKAVFTLESGFGGGDGSLSQGGALFGRQAFVGLAKDGVGKVTMGRQYVFSHDYLGAYSTGGLTAAHSYAYHIDTLDQLTSSRVNNAIKFETERYAGFKAGAMYAFSNEAGRFGGSAGDPDNNDDGSSRAYSFGADYRNGPFGIGFAYTDIAFPLNTQPAFKLTLANVDPGGERNLRTFGLGTRYDFGKVLAYALWTHTQLKALDDSVSTLNIYEGGAVYSFARGWKAGLGYTRTNLAGAKTGAWNQINSSIDYKLSKTTNVYFVAVYQKASGSNDGVPVQAQIGKTTSYFGPSGDGTTSQLAFRIAMKHTF